MWSAGERILLTLWVGSLWAVGYIVAPVLFKQLDRVIAGGIAGQLFTIVSYIGLFVIGIILLASIVQAGISALLEWRNRILLAMLLLVVIGQFVIQPMMAELKVLGLEGSNAKQFATLHGTASVMYLVNSLLGLALVTWGVWPKTQAER